MNLRLNKQEKAYINGATLALDVNSDTQEQLVRLLESMKADGFNTVNFYGLENVSHLWDALFIKLAELGMQAVIRIEDYGSDFSFSKADIPYIIQRYAQLVDFVCQPENRRCVAYFAINMPVDDSRVTSRLEGVNSRLCKQRQVSYACAVVSAVRMETHRRGFHTARLYLSVFYGWDSSYEIPSYRDACADGYFINNYSYPVTDGQVPGLPCTDEELINRKRLERSVQRFQEQYQGCAMITEFGFHTLEYNSGTVPNQTAGLVADRQSKRQAIRATLEYYSSVPEFEGFLYFGYNLYKKEGAPPAVMDWAIAYPEVQR